MGLTFFLWNKFLVNGKYKRKKYESNSIYYQKRDIKTLCYMAGSQIKADFVGKRSEKLNDLNADFSYNVEEIHRLIDKNDIISFDIFDTLVFRPVSKPTDMFWFLEIDNGIFDFKKLRILAEIQARRETNNSYGEVSITDIYRQFNKLHECRIEQMVKAEEDLEINLCFGNEFAIDLVDYAKQNNKKVIAVSDMYLSSEVLKIILNKCNIDIDEIYVSSEVGMNKKDSSLQSYIKKKYDKEKILHIGDDKKCDIKESRKVGLNTNYLTNVNSIGHKYRAFIDDSLEGTIYSGIVNSSLYNGCFGSKSKQYMYGYLYGGVSALAFCQWLNKYVKDERADKIIFLGRDCKIIKQVYEECGFGNESSYMEISRLAILPILATISFENFLLEGFERRINSGYSIKNAFKSIGLDFSPSELFGNILKDEDILCRNNYETFKQLMYECRPLIQKAYSQQLSLLEEYIYSYVKDKKKIIIVDLGWRASTIIFLKEFLAYKDIEAEIKGAVFGLCDSDTTQVVNTLGIVRPFLFSSNNNDVMKVENDELCFTDRRFMFEYMFTSTDNSVIGYKKNEKKIEVIREERDISNNITYINEMHNGIMDFIKKYNNVMLHYNGTFTFSPDLINRLFRKCMKNNNIKDLFPNFNESNGTVHGFKS